MHSSTGIFSSSEEAIMQAHDILIDMFAQKKKAFLQET